MQDKTCQGTELRERQAIEAAVSQTLALPDGDARMKVIGLVFFQQTHTLEGAAMMVPCSERTARRWHTDFIKLVAKLYGLAD